MGIRIILSNNESYQPGSTLEGKAVCLLHKRKEIEGIRIQMVGREHTAWEEKESYYDSASQETKYHTVHYSGDNIFLETEQTIHGAGTIDSGSHEFPFAFTLPKNIPSTYNGSHGHIRYYLKGKVDIEMTQGYETEASFTIYAPINFNTMLNSIELNPTQYQEETNAYLLCCSTGLIRLDVHLEKEAFVLGELIRIKLCIFNRSSTSTENTKVELKMVITEKCTSPRNNEKNETEFLAIDGNTGVSEYGQRVYDFKLPIPESLNLINFENCQLFSQKFSLKIEVVIPGCRPSIMDVVVPIVLGHIPVGCTNNLQSSVNAVSSLAPIPASIPLSYPAGDTAPPYPTDALPPVVPNSGRAIGFAVPNPSPSAGFGHNLSLPPLYSSAAPSGSSAPYPVANAPRDEWAPSAPSKVELAKEETVSLLNDTDENTSKELAPPSYEDAIKKK